MALDHHWRMQSFSAKMFTFLCLVLLMSVTVGEGQTTNHSESHRRDGVIDKDSTNTSKDSITTAIAESTTAGSALATTSTAKSSPPAPLQKGSQPSSTTANSQSTQTQRFLIKNMEFIIIGGLMMACIILLTSTLLLSCKVCYLKRQLSKAKRRGAQDELHSEKAYMMNDITKPEEEEMNHRGPEEAEEAEKAMEAIVEATDEVTTQVSTENETPAVEFTPEQECQIPVEDAVKAE